MTSPYRQSAEPLVVCRPKRTLRGRLRSWWRRRFVVGRATWRFRFRRLPCGHRDQKRRPYLNGAWIWQPPPRRCGECRRTFTASEVDPAGAELGTFAFRDDIIRFRCGHALPAAEVGEDTYVLDLERWCPACFRREQGTWR